MGRQGTRFRAGPFEVAETRHLGGLALPWHAHESVCVHLVLAGVYQEQTRHGSEGYTAGAVLYKPSGEPHSNLFSAGGSRTLRMEFAPSPDVPDPHLGPTHSVDPVLRAIASRLYDETRRPDEFTRLSTEGLCLELLARLGRTQHRSSASAKRDVVRAATRLLEERYREHLCFSDIAHELGVNRCHLARSFREHHRCTMGDYLRGLRVERARQALRETTMPLASIALDAGFADQSHFTRVFGGIVGLSPAAYRRAVR